MAKRGFRIPSFGTLFGRRRNKQKRLNLDWSVGDSEHPFQNSEIDELYTLSPETNNKAEERFVIDAASADRSANFVLEPDNEIREQYDSIPRDAQESVDKPISDRTQSKNVTQSTDAGVLSSDATSLSIDSDPPPKNNAGFATTSTFNSTEPPQSRESDVDIYASNDTPGQADDAPVTVSSSSSSDFASHDAESAASINHKDQDLLQQERNGTEVPHDLFRPRKQENGIESPPTSTNGLMDDPVHRDEPQIIVPIAKDRVRPQRQGLHRAYLGENAAKRVESVRSRLDDALEDWWGQSELLSTALLRDGLLVLEAGHSLDEVHRTLLLRTALSKRRGIVTALRHQTDPDRTAFLMKGALLESDYAFNVADLRYLVGQVDDPADIEDDSHREWIELLLHELHHDFPQLSLSKRRIAQEAIHELEQYVDAFQPPDFRGDPIYDIAIHDALPLAPKQRPLLVSLPQLRYWNIGRAVLVLLLFFTLATAWWWARGRTALADMVTMPAGAYTVGQAELGIPERTISINQFAIDRNEVTNANYRLCYEFGECSLPSALNSATHDVYFQNPDFGLHPVIFVDWQAASSYCTWAGKRLPTADEWEIAASAAPATRRHFVYPWGDQFNRLFANSASAEIGDTQPTGNYTNGASSIGALDMAGNVAEWTSTRAQESAGELYVVKGGSYLDSPEQLSASAHRPQSATHSASWLGFRCARSF